MAVRHGVTDTDKHFLIDPVTRTIINESGKLVLIQYDHNSERFTFECPRYVDDHDMSLCNRVEIHYINTGIGDSRSSGVYEISDLQVSPTDKNTVTCSWLISQNATEYVGKLNFVIRFACTTEDGTIEYAWNTGIYSDIVVSKSIYNGEDFVRDYIDVLETWKQDLYAVGVKISSVEQTTTSNEDGGTNIVSMTMTDGTTNTFQFKNGSKGDPGTPATHKWNGTTLEVTSASGTSSADLKGAKGDAGTSATHKWNGTTLEVTSASGTSSANLKGEKGDKGDKGEDAIPVTHKWKGTTLELTSASGTSSANLKGEKGDKGDEGTHIISVERTSGDSFAGSIDTYTMTTNEGNEFTFTVYNGRNGTGSGDMMKEDFSSMLSNSLQDSPNIMMYSGTSSGYVQINAPDLDDGSARMGYYGFSVDERVGDDEENEGMSLYIASSLRPAELHIYDEKAKTSAYLTPTELEFGYDNNAQITGLGEPKEDSAAANKKYVDDMVASAGGLPIVTTSGTSSAYTATIDGVTELTNGMTIIMIPHAANASNPTLNVNGLGDVRVVRFGSNNTSLSYAHLPANWLNKNLPVMLTYGYGVWILHVTIPMGTDIGGSVPVANGGTGRGVLTKSCFLIGNNQDEVILKSPAEALAHMGITATASKINDAIARLEDIPTNAGLPIVTTSGDANAYTATIDGVTELTNGMTIILIPHVNSAANATLNINDLGAKNIYNKPTDGAQLSSMMLVSGGYELKSLGFVKDHPVVLTYDNNFGWFTDITYPHANHIKGYVPVSSGGIGRGSLTAGSFVIGNGSSRVDVKTPAEALAHMGITVTAEEINEAVASSRTPSYSYGTEDLEAGVSELESGKLYFVYE